MNLWQSVGWENRPWDVGQMSEAGVVGALVVTGLDVVVAGTSETKEYHSAQIPSWAQLSEICITARCLWERRSCLLWPTGLTWRTYHTCSWKPGRSCRWSDWTQDPLDRFPGKPCRSEKSNVFMSYIVAAYTYVGEDKLRHDSAKEWQQTDWETIIYKKSVT